MLGYFSLVGLLRLHSLLGDFYQAVKVLENMELNKKVSKLQDYAYHIFSIKSCLSKDTPFLDAIFSSTSMPDFDLLLRWICLSNDEAVCGCNSYIFSHSALRSTYQATLPS